MRDKTKLPFPPGDVANRLLAWYGMKGRDLPWRKTRDPYRIWLSEIMLQQTTVAAVIPYYKRFLDRFPTVQDLAAATLDDVLELWAGLGYYSRARNLHTTARRVVVQHAGRFPVALEELSALPGIGRSTAGAILSIAYNRPAPILDGNVRRVLVRLFAWQDDPRSSPAERQLWAWAEALTPPARPHDYAQAIMDLGAMVCLPHDPDCACCPLIGFCQAYALGLTQQLPLKRKKSAVPIRHEVGLILRRNTSLLLRRRPPEGLLGGLWEFPVVALAEQANAEQAARRLLMDLGLQGALTEIGTLRHAYSHFKLVLTIYSAIVATVTETSVQDFCWRDDDDLVSLPLHGAHRKALELFLRTV